MLHVEFASFPLDHGQVYRKEVVVIVPHWKLGAQDFIFVTYPWDKMSLPVLKILITVVNDKLFANEMYSCVKNQWFIIERFGPAHSEFLYFYNSVILVAVIECHLVFLLVKQQIFLLFLPEWDLRTLLDIE